MQSVVVQREEHSETARSHEVSGGAERITQRDSTISCSQWWCREKNTARQHDLMKSVVVQKEEHNETSRSREVSGGAERITQRDSTISRSQWWCRENNTTRQHDLTKSVVVQKEEHNDTARCHEIRLLF